MDAGREDRRRLVVTVLLVVVAAVVVASGGGVTTAPSDERDDGGLPIVRSSEPLAAGTPFAVVGDRLMSLACVERCRLLVGSGAGGSAARPARAILLPPGPIEWRPGLHPVPSPDGRRLAFTLVQGGVPRTAVVDLDSGTLLVRSTSFIDEQRLDELAWDATGRRVAIPTTIGDVLMWTVAPARATADAGR